MQTAGRSVTDLHGILTPNDRWQQINRLSFLPFETHTAHSQTVRLNMFHIAIITIQNQRLTEHFSLPDKTGTTAESVEAAGGTEQHV